MKCHNLTCKKPVSFCEVLAEGVVAEGGLAEPVGGIGDLPLGKAASHVSFCHKILTSAGLVVWSPRFRQERLDLALQVGQVALDNIPDDLGVYGKVVVD